MNTTGSNPNLRRCLCVARRSEYYNTSRMIRRNREIAKDSKNFRDYKDFKEYKELTAIDFEEKKDPMKISSIKELESMISTYNGDSNIENWLYKYETIADACCWSDLQKVMYCKRMLKGVAKAFIRLEKCCFSWKQLKHCLETRFSTFDADITNKLQHNLQISDISDDCSRTGKTRTSALERFFQKKNNNSGNSFILRNSTTIKELQEDAAYHDSLHMMNNLQLQEDALRKKKK